MPFPSGYLDKLPDSYSSGYTILRARAPLTALKEAGQKSKGVEGCCRVIIEGVRQGAGVLDEGNCRWWAKGPGGWMAEREERSGVE